MYEGCARAYIGAVEGADIIKLGLKEPRISYLAYHEFDDDPHPPLIGAMTIDLKKFKAQYRNYAQSENPPILHRKELFVPMDYPGRDRFAELTKQEEDAGLLKDSYRIGFKQQWDARLRKSGLVICGHCLMPQS